MAKQKARMRLPAWVAKTEWLFVTDALDGAAHCEVWVMGNGRWVWRIEHGRVTISTEQHCRKNNLGFATSSEAMRECEEFLLKMWS